MLAQRDASALVLTFVVGLAGCSIIGMGGGEDDAELQSPPVTLLIENRNWADITIYAIRGGSRVRLGTVTSMNSAEFVIPAEVAGSGNIRLLADPVGSTQTFLSEPVVVGPGEQIEWRLAQNLRQSALYVW